MYTIQHNPARRYNCDENGISVVQHKHMKRQMSHIVYPIRRSEISCDSRHLCESNWRIHSSVICICKKIYETRTDEWHTS